jgi:hypothetical protein
VHDHAGLEATGAQTALAMAGMDRIGQHAALTGVATMISHPVLSARVCSYLFMPPNTATVLRRQREVDEHKQPSKENSFLENAHVMSKAFVKRCVSVKICCASSRVGATITPIGPSPFLQKVTSAIGHTASVRNQCRNARRRRQTHLICG